MSFSKRSRVRGSGQVRVPGMRLGFLACLAALAFSSCGDADDEVADDASTTAETPADAGTQPSVETSTTAPADDMDAEWAAIVDAANEEGAATLFYSIPIDTEALTAIWSDRYPDIELTIVREPGAALATRADEELDTGRLTADVIYMTDANFGLIKDAAGQLVSLDGGPNLPEAYDDASWWADEGQQTLPIVSKHPFIFAWNTNLVQDPPKTHMDLLDPRWQGSKIGVGPIDQPLRAIHFSLIEEYLGMPDWTERLAEQELFIGPSYQPLAQSLAAGEFEVLTQLTPVNMVPLLAAGMPVDSAPVQEPALGLYVYIMSFADSPNPNAAQALAHFMMTDPEAQALMNAGSISPMGTEVPGTIEEPEGMMRDFEPRYTGDFLAEEMARIQSYFQ